MTVEEYINSLPEERQSIVAGLREQIKKNLPDGFREVMTDMIHYVVPLEGYPAGYHCEENTPLPFMSLVSKKNTVTVHHMGMYADPKLNKWFMNEYHKYSERNPDMGKGCVRFKGTEIPYALVGRLAGKMTVAKWIRLYEKSVKR